MPAAGGMITFFRDSSRAAAVADRTGTGASALRTDLQRTTTVDPDDAAAAGTNLGNVEGRRTQHIAATALELTAARKAAADLIFVGISQLALLDQAGLCR